MLDFVGGFDSGLAKGFLKELGHLDTDLEQLALLLVLTAYTMSVNKRACLLREWSCLAHFFMLVSKGRREHVGKQFESDGQEQLHERNQNKDGEGNQSKQILRGTLELSMFATGELATSE